MRLSQARLARRVSAAAAPAVGSWRADVGAAALGALAAAALPPFYVVPVLLVAGPGLLGQVQRRHCGVGGSGGERGVGGSWGERGIGGVYAEYGEYGRGSGGAGGQRRRGQRVCRSGRDDSAA
jgi:hypothetical protein